MSMKIHAVLETLSEELLSLQTRRFYEALESKIGAASKAYDKLLPNLLIGLGIFNEGLALGAESKSSLFVGIGQIAIGGALRAYRYMKVERPRKSSSVVFSRVQMAENLGQLMSTYLTNEVHNRICRHAVNESLERNLGEEMGHEPLE